MYIRFVIDLIMKCRDGSDALGNEGKDMGSIVLKLRNVAQGVGTLIFVFIFLSSYYLIC